MTPISFKISYFNTPATNSNKPVAANPFPKVIDRVLLSNFIPYIKWLIIFKNTEET
jgi:hypothetical protein